MTTPEDFVATKFSTKEEKQKFATQFLKFVASDFKPSLFTKAFYQRLSNCFSHIAHYNQQGFYDMWFSTYEDKACFLERTINYNRNGDPEWTFSDVEEYLSNHPVIKSAFHTASYAAKTALIAAEKKQLAYLKAKYEA